MANTFIATAVHTAAGVTTVIATTTALSTMLQVGTASSRSIEIQGWGISFAGVTSTDPPGICELIDTGTVALTTGTTLVADQGLDRYRTAGDAASACTCMVHDGSVTEGTITASRVLDQQYVHPQSGYGVWFPSDRRPTLDVSKFLRIRVTFTVSINCIPWIVWDE